MVRIEKSSTFAVDQEVGVDYITNPTNWPHFWADLVAGRQTGERHLYSAVPVHLRESVEDGESAAWPSREEA